MIFRKQFIVLFNIMNAYILCVGRVIGMVLDATPIIGNSIIVLLWILMHYYIEADQM
jgi:hypothetical protein